MEDTAYYLQLINSDLVKQDPHLPAILSNLIKTAPQKKNKTLLDHTIILSKLSYLFVLPSPYEIKNGVRYLRGTNNLVPEKLKVIAIDDSNNKFTYSSPRG